VLPLLLLALDRGHLPPPQGAAGARRRYVLGVVAVSVVTARLITDTAMHELTHEGGGRYRLRTFFHDPEADREMSRDEAGEWVQTVRACGGTVYRGREAVRRD
jgi:hypothetical protein